MLSTSSYSTRFHSFSSTQVLLDPCKLDDDIIWLNATCSISSTEVGNKALPQVAKKNL